MSDFASLLGQLQETATKAAAEKRTISQASNEQRHTSQGNSPKYKRRRKDDEKSSRVRNCKDAEYVRHTYDPPADADQLTVQVSFLCIGAQKSGTTWLHETLRRHPVLCLPDQKEVHFWDWHRRNGLGWYSQQFSAPSTSIEKRRVCGEITPCYAVLARQHIFEIKTLFPKIRLIFIARDLVDRAWSAIMMELRNEARGMLPGQFFTEDCVSKRSMDKLDRETDPGLYSDSHFMERLEHSTHTERSNYASALRKWLEYFPKEQLLIIDYRDVPTRPNDVLIRICNHIDVKSHELLSSLSSEDLTQKVNAAVGPGSNRRLRPSLRKKMEKYLSPFAKDFNELLRELGYEWSIPDYK